MKRRLWRTIQTVALTAVVGLWSLPPSGWCQTPASKSPSAALELRSPDGLVALDFGLQAFEGASNCPVYRLGYKGQSVLADSRLGLETDGGDFSRDLELVGHWSRQQDSSWKPLYGERNLVRDHYNELEVALQAKASGLGPMRLRFRAYNEGLAFCYILPGPGHPAQVKLTRERSEFRFPGNATAWATYSAQGTYKAVALSELKPGCERPLLIQQSEGLFLALAEAGLVDFARMKLAPLSGVSNALVSLLDGPVHSALPLSSPWRVVLLGQQPGQLLEHNYLLDNLNEPCALSDTSWIKPGKVIRDMSLTTQGGKACIDFAAQHHLQYVELDAGWYGPEDSASSDATKVHLDPRRSSGPLDLAQLIAYGRRRDIGIILYVNHRALERQLDELLPLYQSWGVKGVKFGFVNVGSQAATLWLHQAIRKAAAHHLMVDVHDEYRPTGFSRTYPNLMSAEGVAGDETSPSAETSLTILFTRMLAGPADTTVCYYDGRVDSHTSHAFQLAKALCLYSPWQFLYWYDWPPSSSSQSESAAELPMVIGNQPELEFFDHLPTVWDETRVLQGQVGRFAVLARRSGQQWFVGALNSGQSRSLRLPLSFLQPGKKYQARLYSDDPQLASRTHVRIERLQVDSSSELSCPLSAQGGAALWLSPSLRPLSSKP